MKTCRIFFSTPDLNRYLMYPCVTWTSVVHSSVLKNEISDHSFMVWNGLWATTTAPTFTSISISTKHVLYLYLFIYFSVSNIHTYTVSIKHDRPRCKGNSPRAETSRRQRDLRTQGRGVYHAHQTNTTILRRCTALRDFLSPKWRVRKHDENDN